jgi:hypothetical protein
VPGAGFRIPGAGLRVPVASFRLPDASFRGVHFPVEFNKTLYIMSYRELRIYQESKRLAIEVHAMSLELPKFEMYEEGSQVRRSSKSVTSMIVEGILFKYAHTRRTELIFASAPHQEPGNRNREPGNWQLI